MLPHFTNKDTHRLTVNRQMEKDIPGKWKSELVGIVISHMQKIRF